MKPIELYNIIVNVKSIELVTCIGGGYYAGCNLHFSDNAFGVCVAGIA